MDKQPKPSAPTPETLMKAYSLAFKQLLTKASASQEPKPIARAFEK